MLKTIIQRLQTPAPDLITSILLNEETFYTSFLKDLSKCRSEVIIESPFTTHRRLSLLLPTLEKLKKKGVRIAIVTKDPEENDNYMCSEARGSLSMLQHLGIQVIYTENHHRKLAIIDRKILYEGSLNILSHNRTKEVMRRIESVGLSWQMARFIGIDHYLS